MKRANRLLSFFLAFVFVLGMFASGATAFASENPGKMTEDTKNGVIAKNVSTNAQAVAALDKNRKTATALDENLETKITLSFPGKQDVLPSDVVFVLDKSGASAQDQIYTQAKTFLQELKDDATKRGLNVKIGVVLFNRVGNIKKDLTDITTDYNGILQAMNSSVSMGTNMHAGLLAAKKMLDNDTGVKAENKHVVLISDGATYLYCKNNDYTKAYTRSFGDPKKQTNPTTGAPYSNGRDMKGGIWEYQSREYNTPNDWKKFTDGKNFIFSQAMQDVTKLGEYLEYYKQQDQNQTKNWSQYEYEYNFGSAYLGGGRKTTPIDLHAPANIDVALWSTDEVFQEMYNQGYGMNIYFKNAADFDGTVFLKYMARHSNNGNLNTDFSRLKKDILDKIATGSTVTDFMGSSFDFVNDVSKLSLRVGADMLPAEKIKENKYGFGKQNGGNYRFELDYTPGTDEKFVLTVNETIYPEKPVELTYSEKLVTPPKEAGTHTLSTNERATLSPVDGNSKQGEEMTFPVPTVTYTKVQKPTPKPTTPILRIIKIDGDGNRIPLPVTFKITDKMFPAINRVVTTDKSGEAMVAYLRTGDDSLEESKTPEGYVPLDKPLSFSIKDGLIRYENDIVRTIYVKNDKKTEEPDVIKPIDDPTRQDIAATISKTYFGDAKKVILVQNMAYADSMSAMNVSQGNIPILYTQKDALFDVTKREILRTGRDEIIVMGGTNTISEKVIAELKAITGAKITRVDGVDRFEVNKNSAAYLPESTNAVIASGMIYTDALSSVPYAHQWKAPILLVCQDRVPNFVADVLKARISNAVISGGKRTIGPETKQAIETMIGKTVSRVDGEDRYVVSAKMAKMVTNPTSAIITSGEKWSDALVAGPVAQKLHAPVLLTSQANLPMPIDAYLSTHTNLKQILLIGGPASIGESVRNAVKAIFTVK